MVIGKHRQGHAIALSVSGQEMGGGETAYTVRSAAVHEEFLLFMSDSLKVTAASQETMTMLGVRVLQGVSCFRGLRTPQQSTIWRLFNPHPFLTPRPALCS